MKIIHVIGKLSSGGAERVAVDAVNILKERGSDVSFLTITGRGELFDDVNSAVPFFELNRKWKFDPLKFISLIRTLRHFDVIHVHMRYVLRYVSFISIFLKKKNKIVFHDHYGNIHSDRFISKALAQNIRKCSSYIGVSNELDSWAKSHSLNESVPLMVLPNIVRLKEPSLKTKIGADGCHLVMVGNFRKQKNYDYALLLLKKFPESVTLTIYGQVIEKTYYEDILTKITNYGLGDRISIIHDVIDVQAELGQYDVAMHTAESETGPLVLIEYMGQGLPFISFQTGQVYEMVKNGPLSEMFMEDFSLNRWAAYLEKFMYIDTRKSSKEVLLKTFKDSFSEQAYFDGLIKVYKSVIGS